jgi:hypothetical protein
VKISMDVDLVSGNCMKPKHEIVPIFSDSYLHGGIIGCCKQIIATWMECYFVDSIIMTAVML